MVITQLDLAYAAGLFDGEGSVQILHRAAKPKHYAMRVTLANTQKELVEFFRTRWGGSIYKKPTPAGRNYKTSWHWQLASRQAVPFLEALLPYLRAKRPHAELALEFQATSRRFGGGNVVGHEGKPPEVLEMQRELREKLKVLNQRGLSAVP